VRDFLEKLSLDAGEMTLEYRKRLDTLDVSFKSERDIVTEADEAVEDFIVGEIRKRFPEHGIFGEETGESLGTDGHRWIIDPIDGTGSYLHGQPIFSVSIALEKDGEMILGAVNAPVLGELFVGVLGEGAFLNGKPIRVSPRTRLIESMFATGFACMRRKELHNNMAYFEAMMSQIRDVRRMGSAAVDLCFVACGRVEGFWELNLNLYDIAAGMLILREAGGTVTDYHGGEDKLPGQILASNGILHQDLLNIITPIAESAKQSL
jgi:myo-inositol-1(or 4)-monophosphatase